MLPNTLNSNQIKDSAGTSLTFEHKGYPPGSAREFAWIGEGPQTPFRLNIKHEEIGSGISARRRSVVRFDKQTDGGANPDTVMKASAYVVLDSPIGNMTAFTLANDVLAALTQFLATTGANQTIVLDGTSTGAAVLIKANV